MWCLRGYTSKVREVCTDRYTAYFLKATCIHHQKDKQTNTLIVKGWKPQLFGGFSDRETINPGSLVTVNTGMLKGVHLDADGNTLIHDIRSQYDGAIADRIFHREGKPMRMFKI